jgi:hypothetical protein
VNGRRCISAQGVRLDMPFQVVGRGHLQFLGFGYGLELRARIIRRGESPGDIRGVYVFPNDIAIRINLERSTSVIPGDERIAIGKYRHQTLILLKNLMFE